METVARPVNGTFLDVVAKVPEVAQRVHGDRIVQHAADNLPFLRKSLRDLAPPDPARARSALVVCSGPSLKRRDSIRRIVESGYRGLVVAADGAYIACLKGGLVPDYVLTLDPHPSRIVRWFGDPEVENHSQGDDYFERQDLDVAFRKNSLRQNQENIDLVDHHAARTRLVIASSASAAVTRRAVAAGFDMYWWNPIVDDPRAPGSLTRRLREINGLPCMNTGGQTGGACYVFAATLLKAQEVALVGMDCGYYADTPYEQTQLYYELQHLHGGREGIEPYFPEFIFPLTGERFYTDPSYYRYRESLLGISAELKTRTLNCTEGGIVFGPKVACLRLEEFLERHR